MAVNEELISFWENILSDLKTEAGKAEQTRIVPNLEVIDAAPAAPLTNYIIVAGGPGGSFNGPALKLPGYTYTNGDLVNVLFVEGTEPIAMQQGSGSSGSNGGAPIDAQYLTLATNAVLTSERVFTPSLPLAAVDGGADSTYTLSVNAATELAAGVAEIATQTEVTTGTDDTRLVTPLKLATRLSGLAITNTTNINAPAFGTPMTNSSGAAVVAGDIGYMDEAGAFQTTTTANFFTESMLAVVIGGANGATIYVTKTGEMTLNFVSATPSAGDYLVTSTTAGKVTALLDISGNTYMSPEVVAVAVAAGSGSTVQARLLLNTNAFDTFQSVNIFQTLAGSAPPSDFSGTIATLPTASSLTYTPTGGNENALDTAASTDSAKMILHNTTRGTSATMSGVVVGTNTINFVTAYPTGSQVGDTITLRSQTNTGNLSTAYWVDLDLQSTLSGLARSMLVELNYGDGTTNNRGGMHPYTADVAARRQLVRNTSATVLQWGGQLWIPIINNKICVLWQSGGTAANLVLQLRGVKLAAP